MTDPISACQFIIFWFYNHACSSVWGVIFQFIFKFPNINTFFFFYLFGICIYFLRKSPLNVFYMGLIIWYWVVKLLLHNLDPNCLLDTWLEITWFPCADYVLSSIWTIFLLSQSLWETNATPCYCQPASLFSFLPLNLPHQVNTQSPTPDLNSPWVFCGVASMFPLSLLIPPSFPLFTNEYLY